MNHPDNPDRRRHRREKATIDHLVDRVFDPGSQENHQQPATTDSGASVEEQVRKQWDPNKVAVCQLSDITAGLLKEMMGVSRKPDCSTAL